MGAAQAATLLALRERELGFSDSGYLRGPGPWRLRCRRSTAR